MRTLVFEGHTWEAYEDLREKDPTWNLFQAPIESGVPEQNFEL